jgi:hypothetical protein
MRPRQPQPAGDGASTGMKVPTVSTSSPKHIPTIPNWTPADQADWLIGAAQDALRKTEEQGEAADKLISVLQAHAVLGVAAEKLQAAAVAATEARRIRGAASSPAKGWMALCRLSQPATH